jgi:hypothetical protein
MALFLVFGAGAIAAALGVAPLAGGVSVLVYGSVARPERPEVPGWRSGRAGIRGALEGRASHPARASPWARPSRAIEDQLD